MRSAWHRLRKADGRLRAKTTIWSHLPTDPEAGHAGQLRRHAAALEPDYVVAEFYALLGERDQALRYLRQSIAARERLALMMRLDPLLRNLHEDPEYRQLAAQVGSRS